MILPALVILLAGLLPPLPPLRHELPPEPPRLFCLSANCVDHVAAIWSAAVASAERPVVVVVDAPDGPWSTLRPDRGGDLTEWDVREWAEVAWPGRALWLVIVVPEGSSRPDDCEGG